MAISQPQGTDKLNSPDHAKQHRIIAADPAAANESVTVDAGGNVNVAQKMSLGALATPYQHTITVAKSGGDYTSIVTALAAITDNSSSNRYVINVKPGVYTEINPIVMKDYVDIVGTGDAFDVQINATTASANVFEGANYSGLSKLSIYGATSGVGYSMTAAGLAKLTDVFFIDCDTSVLVNNASADVFANYVGITTSAITASYGFQCLAGNLSIDIPKILSAANITVGAYSYGSTSNLKIFNIDIDAASVGTCMLADNGAEMHIISAMIKNVGIGFKIGNTGSGTHMVVYNVHTEAITNYDLYIDSATGDFRGFNVDVDRTKMFVNSSATVNIAGWDTAINNYRFLADVAIGKKGIGNSAYFGSGGKYNDNIKIFSYDGLAFADVTTSNPISFPNTAVNTALYFGEIDSYKFYTIIATMGAAQLSGGNVAWEYYDGGTASWLAFDVFGRIDDYSNSYKNKPFQLAPAGENIAIAFDYEVNSGVKESNSSATGWATTSVNGITGYWVRLRITSAITTSMQFNTVFLNGNSTEFQEDGRVMFYGNARAIRTVPLTIGDAAGATSNASYNVSAHINYSGRENSFVDGNNDQNYFKFFIPEELDTSAGLRLVIDWQTTAPPATETALMHLYCTPMAISDIATTPLYYDGTNTEVETVYNFDILATEAADMVRRVETNRINVANFKKGDVVYMSLKRLKNEVGDTLSGNVIITNISVEYRTWQKGAAYK